jgi:SAM-dependent methyltransferase
MLKRRKIGQELAFGKIPAYCKYELYMERYRHPAELIKTLYAGKGQINLLDVGSGKGRLTYFLNEFPVAWHGIEILDEMIEICKGLGYNMQKHCIQKASLPYADQHFDVVVALHVLEHIDQPERVCKEFFRVLKPGGMLIIGLPVKPAGIAAVINRYYKWRKARKDDPGRTCNAFSTFSLKRFLNENFKNEGRLYDMRGFRLFTARKHLPIENMRWFWRINTWWRLVFPGLTPEVNAIMMKLEKEKAWQPG